MDEKPVRDRRLRREGRAAGEGEHPGAGTRAVVGIAALLSLVVAGISLYGIWKTSATMAPEIGLPQAAAAGSTIIVAALLAHFRNMSIGDVFAAIWETILGLLSIVGAILKGIWNAVGGMLGWN